MENNNKRENGLDKSIIEESGNVENQKNGEQNGFDFVINGRQRSPVFNFFWDLFVILGIAFVCSVFFGEILFRPFQVVGYSMLPNYNTSAVGKDGDEYTDIVYVGDFNNYKVGDVVVFQTSISSHPFIKRIVAVEGDEVCYKVDSIVGTKYFYSLYVKKSGTEEFVKVDESGYIKEAMFIDANNFRIEAERVFFMHFLVGDDTVVIIKDQFYVLGDNRNDSTDSRIIGVIEENSIEGKVYLQILYGQNIVQAIWNKIF